MGDARSAIRIFLTPSHFTAPQPLAKTAAPTMPPRREWDELTGRPSRVHHVTHEAADTMAARTMTMDSGFGAMLMTSVPTVLAIASEAKAPTKLRMAAINSAWRGLSVRVETTVAMAFAESERPFAKSKRSPAMTVRTMRVSGSMILRAAWAARRGS